MPELPEVEVFKRFIDCHALHQPITQVEVLHPGILESVQPKAFIGMVKGRCFNSTLRRGKQLCIELKPADDSSPPTAKVLPWVLLHFGMTGYLSYTNTRGQTLNAYADPSRSHQHIRVRFELQDGGCLNFHEQRLFGKAGLIDDPQAYFREKRLGPDALSMGEAEFIQALTPRKGQIKPALMDQSFVAGIGNVYADEMLFQCGIHPEYPISTLSSGALGCLFQQMGDVLEKTVAVSADRDQLPPGYLLHTRKRKGNCPRDGSLLQIKQVGGRTTYFCPQCQPELTR